MKRNSPLRRYTPLHSKIPLKRTKFAPHPKRKRAVAKRSKLPNPKTVRNKCDKLLTPIIKLMYPKCLLTGMPTEVAHHHVHKSQSNALRYHIPNLIPLTHKAHQALHNNESYYASQIVKIRGLKWFQELEKKKDEYTKADVHWYMENLERLNKLHTELSCEKS